MLRQHFCLEISLLQTHDIRWFLAGLYRKFPLLGEAVESILSVIFPCGQLRTNSRKAEPQTKQWGLFNILCIDTYIGYMDHLISCCHLPNSMHPEHYISTTMLLAHSNLFQLTWHWWKCCLDKLRAHKFYFCPRCQSWLFNTFCCLSFMIRMSCTAFWRDFLYNFGNKFVFIVIVIVGWLRDQSSLQWRQKNLMSSHSTATRLFVQLPV